MLNSNNAMDETSNEFVENKYNQNIVNLYPEYDRDNVDANPQEAASYAKRFPIGEVVTNDLKKSITRETTNQFLQNFDQSVGITTVENNATNAVIDLDKEHGLQALKFHTTLNGGLVIQMEHFTMLSCLITIVHLRQHLGMVQQHK